MTTVRCEVSNCGWCTDGNCDSQEIDIDDTGYCLTFYPKLFPEVD